MPPRPTLILGASGQLGRALRERLPHAHALDQADLDLSDPDAVAAFDFSGWAR